MNTQSATNQQAILKLIDQANRRGSRSPSQQEFKPVLTEERFSQIHKGLSIPAQKVYLAVPVKTAWSAGNINTECARKGFNFETRTLKAALAELEQAGVISGTGGMWVRIKISGAAPKVKADKKAEPIKTGTPIDKLFEIAESLEAQHHVMGQRLAEFRELSLQLYEDFDSLKKQADNAERVAKERIMKKFLEA